MLIIAVDGPAGVGKGTLCRKISETYRVKYLDSGAMYRTIGLNVLRQGGNPANEADAIAGTHNINFDFRHIGNNQFAAFLNGENVNDAIRTANAGQAASKVANNPNVREVVWAFERAFIAQWGAQKGIVIDGQDTGTLVAPHANVKIFLDAAPEIRAQRRHAELQAKGETLRFEDVLQAIIERDTRDRTRPIAPLKPASDAVVIDTAPLNAEQVFEKVKVFIDKAR